MVNYNISSDTTWNTVYSTGIDSNDTVTVTDSFTLTSTNIIEINGANFNGGGFTITHGIEGTAKGILRMTGGGTLRELTVHGNNKTFTSQGVILDNTGTSNHYGTIQCCTYSNATVVSGGGIAYTFGKNGESSSTMDKCKNGSTVTISTGSGGLIHTASNVTLSNCFFNGSTSGASVAGLIKNAVGTSSDTVTITTCYSNFTISGEASGGLVQNSEASNLVINKSYTLGNITGQYAGGILGDMSGGSESTLSVDLDDCYVVGSSNRSDQSMFVGRARLGDGSSQRTININVKTSYQLGSVAGSTVLYSATNTATTTDIGNMVVDSLIAPIDASYTVSATVTTGITAIENGSLPTSFSTSIWTAGASAGLYATLDSFENLSNWDGTYTEYNDTPGFGENCLSGGDPHIITIDGEFYTIPTSWKEFVLVDISFDISKTNIARLRITAKVHYLPNNEIEGLHIYNYDHHTNQRVAKKVNIFKQGFLMSYTYYDTVTVSLINMDGQTTNYTIDVENLNMTEHNSSLFSVENKNNKMKNGLFGLTTNCYYPITSQTNYTVYKFNEYDINSNIIAPIMLHIKTDTNWADRSLIWLSIPHAQRTFINTLDGAFITKSINNLITVFSNDELNSVKKLRLELFSLHRHELQKYKLPSQQLVKIRKIAYMHAMSYFTRQENQIDLKILRILKPLELRNINESENALFPLSKKTNQKFVIEML